jgi:hypothetical protein
VRSRPRGRTSIPVLARAFPDYPRHTRPGPCDGPRSDALAELIEGLAGFPHLDDNKKALRAYLAGDRESANVLAYFGPTYQL